MRISHKHKFIFLSLPRTASTSVRSMLDAHSEIKSVSRRDITNEFPFYHHIAAREIKTVFAQNGWHWGTYRKFCVVRNPFDRVVSLFHHSRELRKRNGRPDLSSFRCYVESIHPDKRLPISLGPFICDDHGGVLVDYVLRFERLRDDLAAYWEQLGIPGPPQFPPHLNRSENRREYREYYDDCLRRRIGQIYQYELERFHYEF